MNTGQITNSEHRKRTLPHPTLSHVGLWETEKIELQSNIVLGEIGGEGNVLWNACLGTKHTLDNFLNYFFQDCSNNSSPDFVIAGKFSSTSSPKEVKLASSIISLSALI